MTSADLPDARELARQAFQAAMNGNIQEGFEDLLAISERFGPDAVADTLLMWIDQVVARQDIADRISPEQVARPVFMNDDGTEKPLDDQLPQEIWSARLIAARAMNDEDGFNAVLASVPENASGDYLTVLLVVCARSVRLALGFDADSPVLVDFTEEAG